jgi:hypothetical protein
MKSLFVGLGLMTAALTAQADNALDAISAAVNASQPAVTHDWRKLATNPTDVDRAKPNAAMVSPPSPQGLENDWPMPNRIYTYLGWGSPELAFMAPNPGNENNTSAQKGKSVIHHDLAIGATALGAAAVGHGS